MKSIDSLFTRILTLVCLFSLPLAAGNFDSFESHYSTDFPEQDVDFPDEEFEGFPGQDIDFPDEEF